MGINISLQNDTTGNLTLNSADVGSGNCIFVRDNSYTVAPNQLSQVVNVSCADTQVVYNITESATLTLEWWDDKNVWEMSATIQGSTGYSATGYTQSTVDSSGNYNFTITLAKVTETA